MFHGVEILKLQHKGTQGYLKAVEKEQIIKWMRTQNYLRLSYLQKYLKKQYDQDLRRQTEKPGFS